jgi:hypothetical protein
MNDESTAKVAIASQWTILAGWVILYAVGVRAYPAELVIVIASISYLLGVTAGENTKKRASFPTRVSEERCHSALRG